MSVIYANWGKKPGRIEHAAEQIDKPSINVEEIKKQQEISCRNELEMQQMAMMGRAQIYRDNLGKIPSIKNTQVPENVVSDPFTKDSKLKPTPYCEENLFMENGDTPLSLEDALQMSGYHIDNLEDLENQNLFLEPKTRTFSEIAAQREREKMGI